MFLVSLNKASSLPGAPAKSYLSKISKRPDRPQYFVQDARGYWQVDLEHPDWLALLEKRTGEPAVPPTPPPERKKPKATSKKSTSQLRSVGDAAIKSLGDWQIAKLKEEVRGKQIDNESKFLSLQKDNGNILDKSLANFLFLGHIERCDSEKFRFPKKIQKEIEMEITGGIKVKKEPARMAAEIVKMILREEEAILRDIRIAQAEDIKNWKEENGIR